jgi:hypothetical protein
MASPKRNPPFRAEHCGSLLRPQELVQKRYDVAAGKAPASELEPLEDKSIAEVVKLQKDAGFHVVSSGEYARSVNPASLPASCLVGTCERDHGSIPSLVGLANALHMQAHVLGHLL